ncbi:putative mitochondrial hypothetical protein [Leptomonas pyrrhocoris]|uniref:Uncharacterized protein n=1 Tax=Leptomonas pyrrhocoris TaxID=157538 RepID=A0A0M9G2Y1_LEPPY|nr:putative mitochondrial hypothetical protein [Leptomonas pyrrhocoris]KPA81089.1 putative mitochondrial hypothetical protein [Leptomonas pyrrhocoris]|eukprot:XP_015659528.1 putative mitochondrial hypothetical protein [Leptomonas pyrrhocoris]
MLSRILRTHLATGAACASRAVASPLTRTAALRTVAGSTSSRIRATATASSVHVLTSKRFVQFEQTSETMQGINTNKRALHNRWVTKSTKEYMSEADSKTSKGSTTVFSKNREQRREALARRKERFREVTDETDRIFDLEMDRIRDDQSRRFKKGFNFFKRQGKAFTLLYLFAYFGTLGVLYLGFASGLLHKEAAFEFMFLFLGQYLDREMFFQRVEAWDTYTNLGFAFVINELLEFIRFPLVMFFFYQARPYLTGVNQRVKSSIFRFWSPES